MTVPEPTRPDPTTLRIDAYAAADRVWALRDRFPLAEASESAWPARAFCEAMKPLAGYGLSLREAIKIATEAARGEEDKDMTDWGWQDANKPRGIVWVSGSLAESYARVSRAPGRWILKASNPASEYHRVMAEQAAKEGEASNG